MGWIKLTLSDETELAFRKKAMERFGYSKGSLSLAAEEAFREWVVVHQKKISEALLRNKNIK